MPFTQPITEIIKKRKSIRSYAKEPIEARKEAALKEFLAGRQQGPLGTPLRFQIMTAHEGDADALKGLGTYGMIKHPAGFLVGAVANGPKNLEDFGYVLEYAVLVATDLDLGTCWLGGSFKQSSFARAIAAKESEVVPAVAALGKASEKPGFLERLVRQSVAAPKRLSWERLFFQANFTTPLTQAAAGKYAEPLEMVRLAPSASNKQPWRMIKEPAKNVFHLYLQRTPGYDRSQKKFFKMADLQRIDMGIAMCHFELTAKEQGLPGAWKIADPGIGPLPEMTEYVVSWAG